MERCRTVCARRRPSCAIVSPVFAYSVPGSRSRGRIDVLAKAPPEVAVNEIVGGAARRHRHRIRCAAADQSHSSVIAVSMLTSSATLSRRVRRHSSINR